MTAGTERHTVVTSRTGNGHTPRLASSSQTPVTEEVVMSPTVTTVDELDCQLAVAVIALGVARHSFDRCPSAENAEAVGAAESSVDGLLDQRYAAQQ
jgi:hypothetical protein